MSVIEDPMFLQRLEQQSWSLYISRSWQRRLMPYLVLSVEGEKRAHDAWILDEGVDLITREAQDRLHKRGMEALRPALSTTIRYTNFIDNTLDIC